MTEGRKALNVVLVLAGFALAVFFLLRIASSNGAFPFAVTEARTPRELMTFLESETAQVKGIKVNGHLLEIGKRPSLQIVRGYNQVMYQMRPYHQVNYKYRNFTKAEVVDFCIHTTGSAFDDLRKLIDSGGGYTPAWKGKIRGKETTIVPVTMFTYFIIGLAEKPLFWGQVELAKRLGMNDIAVLKMIIPDQERWLDEFRENKTMKRAFSEKSSAEWKDVLIEWLQNNT